MTGRLSDFDWLVVGIYLVGVLALGALLARRQHTQADYYLGGGRMGWIKIGLSLAANQVSAISLVGAPAFIALKEGGGLAWLQYELAVPLAMAGIIVLLVPAYHRSGGVTIFQYLEGRFGPSTRMALSVVFLVSRCLGAAVALLATAIVAAVCLNMPLLPVLVGVGIVSVAYTALGGLVADVLSDLLQLGILWIGSLVALGVILAALPADWPRHLDSTRLEVFRWSSTGLGDGATFALWPMVVGGGFLYFSYYGCDQTQAQRLLAVATPREAAKAMTLNALVRFPLVLTYCALGLFLIPFLQTHPMLQLQMLGKPADALVPTFFVNHIPEGLLGIVIAGILAATMSSLDSAVNALSASTWNDLLLRGRPALGRLPARTQVRLSRGISLAWGSLMVVMAAWLAGGHDTVIELVNKIGSAFFGPVAGVFILGVLFPCVTGRGALTGLVAGLVGNLLLWKTAPGVSWMWWNAAGFVLCLGTGWLLGGRGPLLTKGLWPKDPKVLRLVVLLGGWFIVIAAVCAWIPRLLSRMGGTS